MAREKRPWKKRPKKIEGPENAFGLARKFTLAPIAAADPCALDGHLIEPAWDGHRVLATRVGDSVRLAAADFRDWTHAFPNPVRAIAKLPAKSLAIDGVMCVFDERGAPSFGQLRTQVAASSLVPSAVLICWDLLAVDDEDLRPRPLAERRERLAQLLAGAPACLMPSQQLAGSLERVLSAVRTLGIRGVVARPLDGGYDASWRAFSTTTEPVDWQRSLSPPPPLSNADKVLYPRDGICKRDLVAFYREIAPVIVRYLVDRPVVIQRWPDGIDEFDWYQHRMPPRAPDYLRAAWVDGVRRIIIENADALVWMVNQAGLTYHVFASRLTSLTSPDYAMIDLDPGDRSTWWADLIEVALAVRRILELLELPSVVKTSGKRGIHILVPLALGHTFEQAEALGRGVAELLLKLMPDKVTIEQEKDKRHGRLLVDHKQFVAKTLVAPYSLRAADRAPVSTPIAWDEVTPKLDPATFSLRTLRARLDHRGDLAEPLLAGTTRLERALAQLKSQR
ncbi:MAG TPA: non-homologous end-joining DNA ligase [Kofleriaceae bacterium]|nr:non-homologous end-joining DNA ligase [Kofleriaceae bacterium]